MKKTMVKKIILILILLFPLNLFAKDDNCKNVSMNFLIKHVPNFDKKVADFKIISKKNKFGLCQTLLKSEKYNILTPVYVGKDFVFEGKIFSNKKVYIPEEITQAKINKIEELKNNIKRNFKKLKGKEDISFKTDKKFKKTLYMVSDPYCHYCDEALHSIEWFLDAHKYDLKIFLYGISDKSTKKAIEAICENIDFTQYIDKKWKEKEAKEICKKGEEKFNNTKKIIKSMNFPGYPVFFLENGENVVGWDEKAIDELLKNN